MCLGGQAARADKPRKGSSQQIQFSVRAFSAAASFVLASRKCMTHSQEGIGEICMPSSLCSWPVLEEAAWKQLSDTRARMVTSNLHYRIAMKFKVLGRKRRSRMRLLLPRQQLGFHKAVQHQVHVIRCRLTLHALQSMVLSEGCLLCWRTSLALPSWMDVHEGLSSAYCCDPP